MQFRCSLCLCVSREALSIASGLEPNTPRLTVERASNYMYGSISENRRRLSSIVWNFVIEMDSRKFGGWAAGRTGASNAALVVWVLSWCALADTSSNSWIKKKKFGQTLCKLNNLRQELFYINSIWTRRVEINILFATKSPAPFPPLWILNGGSLTHNSVHIFCV